MLHKLRYTWYKWCKSTTSPLQVELYQLLYTWVVLYMVQVQFRYDTSAVALQVLTSRTVELQVKLQHSPVVTCCRSRVMTCEFVTSCWGRDNLVQPVLLLSCMS
jgi:hypothetical protein